jgi:hypothetical protein
MQLRTASIADKDVVDCALWLDRQQIGLGNDFIKAVDKAFNEIRQMPLACPTLGFSGLQLRSELRWLAVERFGHLVVFSVKHEEIVVVAVAHPRQDLETILRVRVGVD